MRRTNIRDPKNSKTSKYTLDKKTTMKGEVEKVMDTLCEYLHQSTLNLILSIEEEKYEMSQEIKDDMDTKIQKTVDLLLRKEWTTLTREEVELQIDVLREGYMKRWYEIVGVPEERHIR